MLSIRKEITEKSNINEIEEVTNELKNRKALRWNIMKETRYILYIIWEI